MVLPLVVDHDRQWAQAGVLTPEISRSIRTSNSSPAESIIRRQRRRDSGDRGICCISALNNRLPR